MKPHIPVSSQTWRQANMWSKLVLKICTAWLQFGKGQIRLLALQLVLQILRLKLSTLLLQAIPAVKTQSALASKTLLPV